MNTSTYDQIEVPMGSFPDYQYIMKDGETYRCTVWEDQILDIQVPSKVVFLVAEAEEAVKGDTVQGATKYVTTETGLKVRGLSSSSRAKRFV
jgi:elongation factor P